MSVDYYADLDSSLRNVKRHVLSYERDGIRLQFYATNVLLHTNSRASNDLTLIVCHGLAMSMCYRPLVGNILKALLVDPAMYFPTIKHLIELLSRSGSGLRLRSIWFMEHANHGDSLLLNESIIVKHFPERCTYLKLSFTDHWGANRYSLYCSPLTLLWCFYRHFA